MREIQENNKEYTIKGIEEILEKVSRRELAEYFGKSEDSDFTQDVLEMLKERNIPSGMEIESFSILENSGYKRKSIRTAVELVESIADEIKLDNSVKGCKFLEETMHKDIPKDGRALIGLRNLPFGIKSMLFLYVDTPITEEQLIKMGPYRSYGGVMTLNSFMGKGFYQKHEQEINKLQKAISKNWDIESLIDSKDLISDETLDNEFDKEVKSDIYNITGKKFEDLTLLELKSLNEKLKKEEEKIQKLFADKYATRSETEK